MIFAISTHSVCPKKLASAASFGFHGGLRLRRRALRA
jgi:hypothetical protein